MSKYDAISRKCDSIIKAIFESESFRKKDKVEKHLVAYTMMLRYIKRVNAHLKNVASTVVNPFHRIGYRHPAP
jgi:phosphate uptake regulator